MKDLVKRIISKMDEKKEGFTIIGNAYEGSFFITLKDEDCTEDEDDGLKIQKFQSGTSIEMFPIQ